MILPIESMPDYIKSVAEFNPFVLSEALLRKSILFQATFEKIRLELGIIIIYIIILFALLYGLQYLSRKQVFHRFTYQRYKRMQKRQQKQEQKKK